MSKNEPQNQVPMNGESAKIVTRGQGHEFLIALGTAPLLLERGVGVSVEFY